jgi:hypothetical protein
MNCIFREHLLPLWFGFNGAAAQHPMKNEKRMCNGTKVTNETAGIKKTCYNENKNS